MTTSVVGDMQAEENWLQAEREIQGGSAWRATGTD